MMVKEYYFKFTQLARYTSHVVADNKAKMSKFIYGVNKSVVNQCRFAMLNSDMNIARFMNNAQQIEEHKIKMREKQNKRAKKGSFNFAQPKSEGENRSQFHPNSLILALSLVSASASKFRDGNRDRAPGSKSQGSVSNARTSPIC
ncbi:hypothetical protein FXO38_20838 [Capsicum annuum]|nr:hypothetical protein FXO38_20838 [Capsicum annuum]